MDKIVMQERRKRIKKVLDSFSPSVLMFAPIIFVIAGEGQNAVHSIRLIAAVMIGLGLLSLYAVVSFMDDKIQQIQEQIESIKK